jgi:hypothetical protein
MVKPTRRRSNRRRYALTLSELEHSKAAVLNSLGSLQSRRLYKQVFKELVLFGAKVGSKPRRSASLPIAP